MELLILVCYIVVAVIIFRKLEKVVYSIVIADVFLRLLTFIKHNITSQELFNFLNKYIPLSIPNIIDKHTGGVINEFLIWIYVIVFIMFEFYLTRSLLRKK
ncbi:MAG: hypothetical protein GX247_02120 [Mollicutes bacterium]|nr:hypothetical protein [Mollicutes bacterium]